MLSTPVIISIVVIIVILLIILLTPEKVTMEYGNPRIVGDKIVVSVIKCTPASNQKCKDVNYLRDKVITFNFSTEKIERLNPTSNYSSYAVSITNNDNININNITIKDLIKQIVSNRLMVPKDSIGEVLAEGNNITINSVPYCNGPSTTSNCFFNIGNGKVQKTKTYIQSGCYEYVDCYECNEKSTYQDKPLCFPTVRQIFLNTNSKTTPLNIDELHFFDQNNMRITVPVPTFVANYSYSNSSQNTSPIVNIGISNHDIKTTNFSNIFNDSYSVTATTINPVANPTFVSSNLNPGIRIEFQTPVILSRMHILNINNTGAQEVLNNLQGLDITVQGSNLQVVRSYKLSTTEPASRAYDINFVLNTVTPIRESDFGKIRRTDEQVGNVLTKRDLCLTDAGNDKINTYEPSNFNSNATNVKMSNCTETTGNSSLKSSNNQSFIYNPVTFQIENPVKAGSCLQAGSSALINPLTGLNDINLQLRKCDANNPNQKFDFSSNGQGTIIKSKSPNFINKCVDHNNTISANQYPLQLKDCDPNLYSKQIFSYIPN
jgi:hypothetical protein